MLQCLFGETPGESSSGYLNQSVETEREFVQVVVQMLSADCTLRLVRAEHPPLPQRRHLVRPRHQLRSGFLLAFQQGNAMTAAFLF
jgi:hypothetical protein